MSMANASGVRGTAAACGAIALIACLAVVYATPSDSYWTVDCGSKAILAERLLATGFGTIGFDYPAATYDPEGEAFPIPQPYATPRDGGFVSQYPPSYPAMAAPFLALLGAPGLRVPAALGVAACALLFAIWTAPAVGRGWAAAGGLALALASPLFFYGVVVWEHSITVALTLSCWVALARFTPTRLLAAGFLGAAACWFRAELATAGIALALACALHRRRLGDPALLALGAAPAVAGWIAFNWIAFGHPLGIHFAYNVGIAGDTAAVGAWGLVRRVAALLGGLGSSGTEAWLLGLGVPACAAIGALSARLDRGAASATALALAAGVWASLHGALQISTGLLPLFHLLHYNGFLVQMPMVALAGLGAVRVAKLPEYAPLRLGITTGLCFLLVGSIFRVTLTEFTTAGHWGPRMLLPAAPALAALAVAALHSEIGSGARARVTTARIGAAALLLVGLISTGVSVWLLDLQKREVRRLQNAILDAPQPVVVTNHPALGQQLAAIWGVKPMLMADDAVSLLRVGEALGANGVGEFLLLHRPPTGRDLGRVGAIDCRLSGQYRGERVRVIFDLDFQVCTAGGRP